MTTHVICLDGTGQTRLQPNIPLFKLVEQTVGAGIAEQIVRGYTFLSRNYEPGDEIIIIGFSRGAAAARCLAGFVVGQGL